MNLLSRLFRREIQQQKDCNKPTVSPDKESPLEEDFYMENGFMVFTQKYHEKRGYCCGSGCRHCPYEEG